MEILINSKTSCEHELELVVPISELEPHFEKFYKKYQRDLAIPGFRKGRVPMKLIKRRFGKAIEFEAIDEIVNDFFKQAMEERDIKPIGQPSLKNIDYKEGEHLVVKISYETGPEFELKNYEGLELEKIVHEVTEEEIEARIEQMRERMASFEEVEKPTDEDFIVTCDIELFGDDEKSEPEKRENMRLDLRDESMHPDLKAEILNMKVGDVREVELTYDSEEKEEELAEGETPPEPHVERMRVALKKAERIVLPEVDEEFAKKVSEGKYETLEELREDLRGSIAAYYEERAEENLHTQIIEKIVENNPFDVPESLVKMITDDLVEQVKQQYFGENFPEGFDVDSLREDMRPKAVRQAKWMFLREEIIRREKIAVEDEDVEAKAEEGAERMGIDKEQLVAYYKQNSEAVDAIRNEKLFTLLKSRAEIKEVQETESAGE
ncbi:MAG: trigger factor [Chlorobi bacterium]|nr:trigger factor [Chlorobiota bacterium]